MTRAALAVVATILISSAAAQARPSPSLVTQFDGDRFSARTAQMGWSGVNDVTRQRVRKPKAKRPPKYRIKHVPGMVARLTVTQGLALEVERAVGRPAAWCGWWLGQHLGMHDRRLWLARNWASRGQNAGGPGIGVVVVWRHHVGIITGQHGNQWVIKSGNDGRRVRERPRSVASAIAFRRV